MNRKKIRERLGAISREMKVLADKADADDRDFTEEEDKEFVALTKEANGLKTRLDRLDTIDGLTTAGAQAGNGDGITGLGGDPPPGTQATAAAVVTATGAPVLVVSASPPNGGYSSAREFLLDVYAAGRTGQLSDRLRPLQSVAGADEHSTVSDAHGGFLVPTAFLPRMLEVVPEADFIAGRTMDIPMESPSVDIPARVDKDHSTSVSGGLIVTRKAETVAATSSRMEVEKVNLKAHSLFGVSFATEELLNDSPLSLIALLERGFNQEFGSRLVDERLNGTGVGEFEGINNTPSLIVIAKESGQAADTVVYENIINMRARCWLYAQAMWIANHDSFPQLSQIVGPDDRVIWHTSAKEDAPELLLGRPLHFTEYSSTLGDQGDLLLAVWSEYLEGTYTPMQQADSVHVRFLEHERTFKFWMRNDGRAWWRSALTPKNGATLSPFVTLAERT